jgi:hypothetical protein
MDLGKIVWSGMGWTDLTQERDLVNTVIYLRVP